MKHLPWAGLQGGDLAGALPQASLSASGVLAGNSFGYRIPSALAPSLMFPVLAWSNKLLSSNVRIPDNHSVYISGGYEILAGYTLEIGSGAVLEVG